MLFNSIQFFLFFPIVACVHFAIPYNLRWLWLLGASCYFYMAFMPIYIIVLFILILIDFIAGILIERTIGKKRKLYLIMSILSTCLVLFIFKYYNFFNMNFARLAEFLHWNYPANLLSLVLPIGLSFHTFQSLSYVIEVYRGNQKAEHNFGIYSLYVMFLPQLVAGPIERPQNLLHQFYEKHDFDYKRVTDGLKLALWGLFKKVVIADRVSLYVNQIYNNAHDYYGLTLILATVFFAFQIYCDFSGYSDIAIGIAQILGFKLMDNFNRPYFSKNIAEFWKRWHISLSSWFRDYLYISLGGNRVGKWRWYYNLFIVFLISGLWHGANWTFVLWGALNGFYLIFSIITAKPRSRITKFLYLDRLPILHKYLRVLTTFSLVCFAWIFFRANSLSDAVYIATHLFIGLNDKRMLDFIVSGFGGGTQGLIIAMAAILLMEFVHFIERHENIRHMLSQKPAWLRLSVYSFLTMSILVFGNFTSKQFIYFQF